jgi:Ser/Thr protein kinase RdoA (MazF antagonist)
MDEPLNGGRSTPAVFRRGERVHRTSIINSEFVRLLLRHLENVDFDAAPRSYGLDENYRDMFSFIEGKVPTELQYQDTPTLESAGRLIRRFHDATTGLLSDVARAAGMEVVCHNDLSPCNFVFRGGKPVAIIDFDAASFGRRVYDLGYAAWLWLQLGDEDISPEVQWDRLQLFIGAYGPNVVLREVVDAALLRQAVLVQEGERIGNPNMRAWADAAKRWTTDKLLPLMP